MENFISGFAIGAVNLGMLVLLYRLLSWKPLKTEKIKQVIQCTACGKWRDVT